MAMGYFCARHASANALIIAAGLIVSALDVSAIAQGGLPAGLSEGSQRPFYVGNSLTYNQVAFDWVGFLAAQRGVTSDRGYHLRYGTSMSGIYNEWTQNRSVSFVRGGPFDAALGSGNYSSLVLQPFHDSVNAEIDAARSFIGLTQRFDIPVFVYQTWTARVDGAGQLSPTAPFSYSQTWNAPYTNPSMNVGFNSNRAYFQTFTEELQRLEPDRPIAVIPAGDVFMALDARMQAGQINGLTSITSLYSDPIHLNELGAYVVALTMYGVMYGDDPRGLTYPVQINDRMTPELSSQLQEVVWSTLAANFPLTGIPTPSAVAVLGLGSLMVARRRR